MNNIDKFVSIFNENFEFTTSLMDIVEMSFIIDLCKTNLLDISKKEIKTIMGTHFKIDITDKMNYKFKSIKGKIVACWFCIKYKHTPPPYTPPPPLISNEELFLQVFHDKCEITNNPKDFIPTTRLLEFCKSARLKIHKSRDINVVMLSHLQFDTKNEFQYKYKKIKGKSVISWIGIREKKTAGVEENQDQDQDL